MCKKKKNTDLNIAIIFLISNKSITLWAQK